MNKFIELESAYGVVSVNTSLIDSIVDCRIVNSEYPTSVKFSREVFKGDKFPGGTLSLSVKNPYKTLKELLIDES